MEQDRQTIMAAGFEGYQSKPLNIRAFLEAVRQVLDRTSAQRRQ
jgi:CheY-like chemotaxis protein